MARKPIVERFRMGGAEWPGIGSNIKGMANPNLAYNKGMLGFISKEYAKVGGFVEGKPAFQVVPGLGGQAFKVMGKSATGAEPWTSEYARDLMGTIGSRASFSSKEALLGSLTSGGGFTKRELSILRPYTSVNVPSTVLKRVLSNVQRFTGTYTPTIGVSPLTGIDIEGIRIPTIWGKGGEGDWGVQYVTGLPKPVMTELIKQQGIQYKGVSGAKLPSFILTPSFQNVGGRTGTVQRTSVEHLMHGALSGKNIDARTINRRMYENLLPHMRYEGQPYAASYYAHSGTYSSGPSTKAQDTLLGNIGKAIGRAKNKATAKGWSVPRFLHEQQIAIASTVGKEMDEAAFSEKRRSNYETPINMNVWAVKDLHATTDRGMVFSKGLGQMFTFGLYEDPARAPMQRVRVGRLSSRVMSRVKHMFPYDMPLAMTKMEEEAELFHRAATGVPSGVMVKAGMVLEEEGKLPYFHTLNSGQGEIITDKLTALAMTRDLTMDYNLQQAGMEGLKFGQSPDEYLRKKGLQGIHYESMFHRGKIQFGPNVMLDSVKSTVKGVANLPGGLNVLMSQMNIHSKYPAMYRRMLLDSILSSIGTKSSDVKVAKAQTDLMYGLSRIFSVNKKGRDNLWRVDKATGATVPSLRHMDNARFDQGIYQRVEGTVEKYNRSLSNIVGPDKYKRHRARTGMNIEELPIDMVSPQGNVISQMRRVLTFNSKLALREHSHTVTGMLNAQAPSTYGFKIGAKHGQKVTDNLIAHLKGMSSAHGQAVARQLEVLRNKAMEAQAASIQHIIAPLGGSSTTTHSAMIADAMGELGKGKKQGKRVAFRGLKELRRTLALVPLPTSEEIKSIEDLTNTILDPKGDLFDAYATLNLDKPMEFKWKLGGREETTLMSQLPIPNMKEFESLVAHGKATGEFHLSDLVRKWDRFLNAAKNARKEEDVHDAYSTALRASLMSTAGREGALRKMIEPRVSGSFTGSITAQFSDVAASKKFNRINPPGESKRLGRVGISEGMAKNLGILDLLKSGKEGDSIYGLMTRYPEQAVGNTWAVKMYLDERVTGNGVSVLNEMLSIAYGDSDADQAAFLVSPFKAGTKEFEEFQRPIKGLFEELESTYYSKQAAGKSDLRRMSRRAIENRQFLTDPKAYFKAEASTWSKTAEEFDDLFKSNIEDLDARQTERLQEGFRAALGHQKAKLFEKVIGGHYDAGSAVSTMMLSRQMSTKKATPLVVSAMAALGEYTEYSNVGAMKNLLKSTEKAKTARGRINASILQGLVVQEGSIQKAELSKLDFFQVADDYWKIGNKEKVRDYVKTSMTNQMFDYIPGDSAGLRFLTPGFQDMSATLDALEADTGSIEGARKAFTQHLASGSTKEYKSVMGEMEATSSAVLRMMDAARDDQVLFRSSGLDKLMGRSVEHAMAERGVGEGLAGMQELVNMLKDSKRDPDTGELLLAGADKRTKHLITLMKSAGLDFNEDFYQDTASDVLSRASDIAQEAADRPALRESFGDAIRNKGFMTALGESQMGSSVKGFWDWITKGPAKADKYYDLKRAGIVGGAALFGAAVVKAAFWPNIVPDEPRESSYVDMAPPESPMLTDRAGMNSYHNTGGNMPSAAPLLGESVGDPQVAVAMGAGIRPQQYAAAPPVSRGMAPMPPPQMNDSMVASLPQINAVPSMSPRMSEDYGMFNSPIPGVSSTNQQSTIASRSDGNIMIDSGASVGYTKPQSSLSINAYELT